MKIKHFFLMAFVSLFAVVAFSTCSKDEEDNPTDATLSVDKTTIDATATASTYPIAITSDTIWTVASSEAWCTVSPASGKGNGTLTVGVAATVTVTITAALKIA
jgi:hypothetical protein